jgi:hypothetical protein
MNVGGHVFVKGEPEDVEIELALQLKDNPRFKVTGLDTREAVEYREMQTRPSGRALYAAILEAQDRLDIDDDDSFDRHGKPAVAALSKVLGYPITKEERDAALRAAPKVAHEDEGKPLQVNTAEIAQHAASRGSSGGIKLKKQPAPEDEGVTV